MADYVFGANLLEILTTGMYQYSQIIFREYIQNSCDAIDKAVSLGILKPGEGKIDIWIDKDKRIISVEDNGTGIFAEEFELTLQSIAQSSKQLDTEKGFRGIGRLCGLAYCRKLVFSTTAKGEESISTMKIDSQKLRNHFYGETKYTAQEVLDEVITIEKSFSEDVRQQHWFKVELIDISSDNRILLDEAFIRDYLSFVAPVEYRSTFFFSQKIYEHATNLNLVIDEYRIDLNGDQLVKKYKTDFKTSKGSDEIFDLSFEDFYDDAGKLIAWSWIGLSKFKGVINQKIDTPDYKMRSIRLRKGNIQIGEADALQKLFKEERGIHYFIGEVFAVDKDLIPNSQRNYFIENRALRNFETALTNYFLDLRKVYYMASDVNSALRVVEEFNAAEENFNNQVFVSKNHRDEALESLGVLRAKAEDSSRKIKSRQHVVTPSSEDILSRVANRILEKPDHCSPPIPISSPPQNAPHNLSRIFPNLKRDERKLVLKILDVIRENTDAETFETLQHKIVEVFGK